MSVHYKSIKYVQHFGLSKHASLQNVNQLIKFVCKSVFVYIFETQCGIMPIKYA